MKKEKTNVFKLVNTYVPLDDIYLVNMGLPNCTGITKIVSDRDRNIIMFSLEKFVKMMQDEGADHFALSTLYPHEFDNNELVVNLYKKSESDK